MHSLASKIFLHTIIVATCGCTSLFPPNIYTPESIFTDTTLGTRGAARGKGLSSAGEALDGVSRLSLKENELPPAPGTVDQPINIGLAKTIKPALEALRTQINELEIMIGSAAVTAKTEAMSKDRTIYDGWSDVINKADEVLPRLKESNSPISLARKALDENIGKIDISSQDNTKLTYTEYNKLRAEIKRWASEIGNLIAPLVYSISSASQLTESITPKGGNTNNAASADVGVLEAQLEGNFFRLWRSLVNYDGYTRNESLGQATLAVGLSLIDHRCNKYFNQLGVAAQKLAFGNRELGITGGLVSALQGLTGVAARDIAITGSGFSFLSSSSNAYGDIYLFTPDIGTLQQLVGKHQDVVKDGISARQAGTFPEVTNALQIYAKTCEVATIRRLINSSLTTARLDKAPEETPKAPKIAIDSTKKLEQTKEILGRSLSAEISDDRIAALYWLTSERIDSNPVPEGIKSILENLPDAIFENKQKFQLKSSSKVTITSNLLNLPGNVIDQIKIQSNALTNPRVSVDDGRSKSDTPIKLPTYRLPNLKTIDSIPKLAEPESNR